MLPDISSSCIVSLHSKYNWGPKFNNRAFSVGQLVNYAIRVVINYMFNFAKYRDICVRTAGKGVKAPNRQKSVTFVRKA